MLVSGLEVVKLRIMHESCVEFDKQKDEEKPKEEDKNRNPFEGI